MAKEKYIVPEGMRVAAHNASGLERDGNKYYYISCALEAALRWLDAKLEEMDKEEPFDRDLQIDRVRALWLVPEPEHPKFNILEKIVANIHLSNLSMNDKVEQLEALANAISALERISDHRIQLPGAECARIAREALSVMKAEE